VTLHPDAKIKVKVKVMFPLGNLALPVICLGNTTTSSASEEGCSNGGLADVQWLGDNKLHQFVTRTENSADNRRSQPLGNVPG